MTRTLLVEDEDLVVSLYVSWLGANHVCRVASSLKEARVALAEESFDLMVLDHVLPDGSGLDLLCELHDRGLDIPPVLLVTGYGSYALASRAVDRGVWALCSKPTDESTFRLKVQACLDGRRAAFTLHDGRLGRLETYLEANLHRGVELEEVLPQVGMSRSTFYRWLKRLTGRSFSELLSETRLRVARSLITETDRPISEVAERAGFRDQSYFTRWFRRRTGITPLKAREAARRSPGA